LFTCSVYEIQTAVIFDIRSVHQKFMLKNQLPKSNYRHFSSSENENSSGKSCILAKGEKLLLLHLEHEIEKSGAEK